MHSYDIFLSEILRKLIFYNVYTYVKVKSHIRHKYATKAIKDICNIS